MPSTILDSAVFRDIFTTPAMRQVWSDENRVQKYLDFEAALARAQGKLGIIPKNAAAEIVRHCDAGKIDMAKLKEATERIGYPVLPVVQQLVKLCKNGLANVPLGRHHPITDTATVLQIEEALDLLEKDIDAISDSLAKLAKKYRDTPMAGAQPAAGGADHLRLQDGNPSRRLQRHKQRLKEMRPRVLVGEFGGAAGTLSSLGKDGLKVQKELMKELKLGEPDIPGTPCATASPRSAASSAWSPAPAARSPSTSAIDADRSRGSAGPVPPGPRLVLDHAAEAQPDFFRLHHGADRDGQATRRRAAQAQVEDHERSTGPWEIEWIALPEIFMLSAGALSQTRFVVDGLQVNEKKMRENLRLTNGLIMSEAVMMGLGAAMGRNRAHDVVYDVCREVVKTGRPLLDLLEEDKEIRKHADRKMLEKLTDPANYLGVAGEMVDRVLKMRTKR